MKNKMQVYVKYLDSKNKFTPATKDFETFEAAWQWVLKTFDRPSKDYIHYY